MAIGNMCCLSFVSPGPASPSSNHRFPFQAMLMPLSRQQAGVNKVKNLLISVPY
jgi:hypothetical protein